MTKLWPTRRRDTKVARLIIKKHSPKSLESLDPQSLSETEKLKHLFPWVTPLIQRFRKEHDSRDWMVCMLKAIDAVITPLFKDAERAATISQQIVTCIKQQVNELDLAHTFDAPKATSSPGEKNTNTNRTDAQTRKLAKFEATVQAEPLDG